MFPDGFYTRNSYFRLLLPVKLPNVSKILYIDEDTLIFKNILQLWNENIDSYLIGGIIDPTNIFHSKNETKKVKRLEVLGMCYGKYINSGVLLMNLDNLRKEDFVSKSLVLIKEKMNCEWYDQDIINYVCKDKIKFLNYQWNTLYLAYVNHLFLYVKFKTKIYPNFSLFNFKKSVAILHFAGECKPWVFTKNYFAKEWKKIWDIIFKG